MAFTTVCSAGAVREGGMALFQLGKKSVLLVWPAGDELRAYRGRCPHADMPLTLSNTSFDGDRRLTCAEHGWGFDCASGKCLTHVNVRNALHPYAVRIAGDEIQVDVPEKKPRPT